MSGIAKRTLGALAPSKQTIPEHAQETP